MNIFSHLTLMGRYEHLNLVNENTELIKKEVLTTQKILSRGPAHKFSIFLHIKYLRREMGE